MHTTLKTLAALAGLGLVMMGGPEARGQGGAGGAGAAGGVADYPDDFSRLPRGERDPANAALLLYKVWLDPAFQPLREPCAEQLRATDPGWRPDAALSKLLSQEQGLIAQLLRASEAPECDFGIEWSQGIGALLPHLGYLRNSARILACDARRCISERKFDDAAGRVAAIYRLSAHCANDGVLISALVSLAMATLADQQVDVLMQTTSVTVTGKEVLLEAAVKLSRPDPYGVKRGIAGERYWTCDWLRGLLTGPESQRAKVLNWIVPMVAEAGKEGVDSPSVTAAEALKKMTDDMIIGQLNLAGKYFDDVLEVWDREDAPERIKAIESRLESGDYGLVATILVPAVGRAIANDAKGRAQHEALVERLRSHIALSR